MRTDSTRRHLGIERSVIVVDRVWLSMAIVAVVTVLATSNVGLDLWFFSGPLADAVGACYIGSLIGTMVLPLSTRAHTAAMALAALFWAGRGLAFLELVLDQARYDLLGAVAERAAIATAFCALHLVSVRRTTYFTSVELDRRP